MAKKSELIVPLRIDFPCGDKIGRGKMQLLEHIKSTGSITAAGRAMGMSYRRSWLLVYVMNTMFSEPIVVTQRGGKRGGGAMVTDFGNELLERYRKMEEKIAVALESDLDWLGARRSADRPTLTEKNR